VAVVVEEEQADKVAQQAERADNDNELGVVDF
jgi:hypothetical protein